MNIIKKLISKLKPPANTNEISSWYNKTNDGCNVNSQITDIKAPSSCELNCTKSISRR